MRRKDREVAQQEELRKIISQCKTCHVAMIDGGIPYIVPLSYGYRFLGGNILELFFHSALEGKKLDLLRKNSKVCFEMSYEGELIDAETPCCSGYCYASVIGYGDVVFIEDTDEKCKALSLMFKHQLGRDVAFNEQHLEKVCIYKIISTDFTGKMKPVPNN